MQRLKLNKNDKKNLFLFNHFFLRNLARSINGNFVGGGKKNSSKKKKITQCFNCTYTKVSLRLLEKIYLRLLENAKMTKVENKAKVIIKILPEYTKQLNILKIVFKMDRSLIWVIWG